jgi:hypothetical protein
VIGSGRFVLVWCIGVDIKEMVSFGGMLGFGLTLQLIGDLFPFVL